MRFRAGAVASLALRRKYCVRIYAGWECVLPTKNTRVESDIFGHAHEMQMYHIFAKEAAENSIC